MKKKINFILKLLMSLLIIYFLFKKVDLKSLSEILFEVKIRYLLAALFISLFCWLINSEKWRILLKHIGIYRNRLTLFRLNLVGIFYSVVLPGGQITGEVIKSYKIIKNSNEKTKLVFSILMDRITGLVALIMLGFLGILFTASEFDSKNRIISLFIVLFFSSFLILLFFQKNIAETANLYFQKISLGKKSALFTFSNRLIGLLLVYKGKYAALAASIFYGLIFQAFNIFSIYILALSINLEISIFNLFWAYALVSIILIAPITILGLGLREGSFVVLLGLMGISSVNSLSLSFLVSFIFLMTGIIGGVIEIIEQFFLKKINTSIQYE